MTTLYFFKEKNSYTKSESLNSFDLIHINPYITCYPGKIELEDIISRHGLLNNLPVAFFKRFSWTVLLPKNKESTCKEISLT